MSDVRVLSYDELDSVVDLLVPVLREAPLNEWLLGEYSGDPVIQRWLVELQLIERLRAGHVLGGFDGRELVGVLVWSHSQPVQLAPEPEFLVRSATLLQPRPELVRRLAEFQDATVDNPPPPPNVTVMLAGLARHVRGRDLMGKLLEPVFVAAEAAGAGVWFATAAPEIGASSMARFGFEPAGEYAVGPVTMHAYLKPSEAT